MRYRNRCKVGGSKKGSEEQLCHWDLQSTHLRRKALDDHMQLPRKLTWVVMEAAAFTWC